LGWLLAEDLEMLAWSSSEINQASPCAHMLAARPVRSHRAEHRRCRGARRGHDGLGAVVPLGKARGEGGGRTGQGEGGTELTP
jgi:hypothetical protein